MGCTPRLSQPEEANITVFPNPTSEGITLSTESDLLKDAKVIFFDEVGKKVHEIQTTEQTMEFQIDLRTFASGMYMIQVVGKEGDVSTYKIVKE